MGTKLPFVFGARVMFAGCLGCLVVGTAPTVAKADPVYKTLPCVVRSTRMPPDAPPVWSIKGIVEVTNIPANAKQLQVRLRVERKGKTDPNWSTVFEVVQTTTLSREPIVIDTDYQKLDPAPRPGDEFRVIVVSK